MTRGHAVFSLCFALIGCGASVSPDPRADRPASLDASEDRVSPPPDSAVLAQECRAPADCADRVAATAGVRFSMAWSCVGGACTWEPTGGQTCQLDARGCGGCGGLGQCSAPCITTLDRSRFTLESSSCARDFFASVDRCNNNLVRLTDGTVCLLTEAPTGALRYVLNCGDCETVFMPHN